MNLQKVQAGCGRAASERRRLSGRAAKGAAVPGPRRFRPLVAMQEASAIPEGDEEPQEGRSGAPRVQRAPATAHGSAASACSLV